MAAIYSTQFLATTITAGTPQEIFPPAGHVYIIRDIEGALYTTESSGGQLQLLVNEVTVGYWWLPASYETPISWSGRIVLPGSSTAVFQMVGSEALAELVVCGYDLVT